MLGIETRVRSITVTTHLLLGYSSSSSSHPHQQHHPAICNRFSVLSPMNQPGKRKPNANLPLSLISPYKAGPRADKKKRPVLVATCNFYTFSALGYASLLPEFRRYWSIQTSSLDGSTGKTRILSFHLLAQSLGAALLQQCHTTVLTLVGSNLKHRNVTSSGTAKIQAHHMPLCQHSPI